MSVANSRKQTRRNKDSRSRNSAKPQTIKASGRVYEQGTRVSRRSGKTNGEELETEKVASSILQLLKPSRRADPSRPDD